MQTSQVLTNRPGKARVDCSSIVARRRWTLILNPLRILVSLFERLDPMQWGNLRSRIILAAAVLSMIPVAVLAQETALDLDGHAANPMASADGKVVVLVFLRRDCPVSSRYAPVIQQISKEFAAAADFWLVDPDKTDTPPAIRSYLSDYNYHLPALRDPSHVLVKMSHVQITPEVAVFGHNRQLVYDGRIDDWYVDLTRSRVAPTTHELEDAIRAAVAGKPVSRSEVRGVGCYISDLD
ncbi:MAG TPA: redoxin domain-containing protein [Silvibacterium sp.]|nr:redoxin domain-containing protein [Silvibacterium sp.]